MDEETVWVVAPLTTIYINDDRIFHAGDVVTPDDFESWAEFRAMIVAEKIIGQKPPEPGPEPDPKWDGFTIDNALSTTSINPVQNKIVTAAIEAEKAARTLADGEHDAAIAALKQADQLLAASVTAEQQRATQAETALGERVDAIDEKIPSAEQLTEELVKRIKEGNGTEAGLLRLSDATDGTQGTGDATAATPSAVKKAYDLASSAGENAETALNRLSSETAARQEVDDALGRRIDDVSASVQSLEQRAAEGLTEEQYEEIASILDGTYVGEEDGDEAGGDGQEKSEADGEERE